MAGIVNRQDRFRGALLGMATGDALGTTLEFTTPGSFVPLTDMVGGGPFRLQAGQWTDDTSMGLCLAESLIHSNGFDASDQMKRYVNWWRHGYLSSTGECFDIGITTSTALRQFERSGNPFSGSTAPNSAGNGSIMRLAAVPLWYADDFERGVRFSAESSRTTHGAPACIDACRYLGGLIIGAVRGLSKTELLAPYFTLVPDYWHDHPLVPEIAEIAAGSFRHRQPPAIKGSGYVVKSLEAALWAFYHSDNFRDGALLAVNLGDDADTTGAVYGQLAGAYYGASGIPQAWREKLAMYELIVACAEKNLRSSLKKVHLV